MADTRRGAALNPLGAFQLPFAAELQRLEELRRQKAAQLATLRRSIDARIAAARGPAAQPKPDIPNRLREEARAAVSGVADGALFGVADPMSAAVKAMLGQGGSGDFGQRFQRSLAAEEAQDRYDKTHYGGARFGGQAAGAVASLALGGGVLGGARAAAAAGRMAPNVNHVLRLAGVQGGIGGVLGAGTHVAADAATGVRTTPADLGASLVGGVVGGAATPFVGPLRAGALTGSAVPVIEGVLSGNAPRLEEVLAGGGAGLITGKLGKALTDKKLGGLNWVEKGKLGEDLSQQSRLGGVGVRAKQQRVDLEEGYTRADYLTDKHVVEVKFGGSNLSKRQRQARDQLANYLIEHWLPRDLQSIEAVRLMGLAAPNINVPSEMRIWVSRDSTGPSR